jgi:hypothetical protein
MTDKCRAPNMCKLALWNSLFDAYTWLYNLPPELLVLVAKDMGYKFVGRNAKYACLQYSDVYITFPLRVHSFYEDKKPVLDGMTEVVFMKRLKFGRSRTEIDFKTGDIRVITPKYFTFGMRMYFNKRVVIDLGNSIKAYVESIEIDPYSLDKGFLSLFIPVTKENKHIGTIYLGYVYEDNSVSGSEDILTSMSGLKMLPYVIEDILDSRYGELRTILENAFEVVHSIGENAHDFLKRLSKTYLGNSLEYYEEDYDYENL